MACYCESCYKDTVKFSTYGSKTVDTINKPLNPNFLKDLADHQLVTLMRSNKFDMESYRGFDDVDSQEVYNIAHRNIEKIRAEQIRRENRSTNSEIVQRTDPALDPVKAAMEFAVEEEKADPEEILKQIKDLEEQRAGMLPIEKAAIKDADVKIKRLREEYMIHTAKQATGYRRIDLRIPFTWRMDGRFDDRYPRLGIYSIENPETEIRNYKLDENFWKGFYLIYGIVIAILMTTFLLIGAGDEPFFWTMSSILLALPLGILATQQWIKKRYYGVFPVSLPQHLTKYYMNDVDRYLEIRGNNLTQSIKSEFPAGQIPTETRQKIKNAIDEFGKKNIFIVAEARWSEGRSIGKPNFDPLIIAVKDEITYLVDAFDLTEIEKMTVEEFTF